MKKIPVSDPPPLRGDGDCKYSDQVLVHTSYGTIIIATLEQEKGDDAPKWYAVPSEERCLHDDVLFWTPLS
jgi:hypothetical protein